MTFKRIGLFLCLATAAMLSPLFAQRNVSGVWRLRVQRPDGTTQDRFLKLTQSENSVAGTIVTNYRPAPIRTGSFENGKLHLEVSPRGRMTITYDGSLAADRLNLKITTNRPSSSRPTEVLEATGERSTEEASLPPKPLPVPALHDVPDNGLVRTPPMGWNSWNHFAGRVSDATVRAAADAIVASGMKAAGYEYVNIDDTWEGTRDANGNIQSNRKFPDMKALAAYVHSKGLKIGLYSSPGPLTCAGYEGSFGHEEQDAKTYADWGFDYLKYDWCSAGAIYKDEDLRAVYQKMGDALAKAGRPIVYSLCEYGRAEVWTWGVKVDGNLWRTTGDISDNWKSMEEIGFRQADIAKYAQPGHWNDPDMLEVGNGGMTTQEYQVHMSLWALLAAPLLAGNDLHDMSQATLALLKNGDIIAIDQDPTAHPVKRTALGDNTEVWTRELKDGAIAVGVFNRNDADKEVTVSWSKLGTGNPSRAKNLWTHQDVSLSGDSYTASVPMHGVVMLRVEEH